MLTQIKPYKKIIYLDYAAATPLDFRVRKAMEPFWDEKFGNPSSLHKKGREAKDAVDDARRIIAGIVGARPQEIIFTAGGTESVNLAIFGAARAFMLSRRKKPHIITLKIEHHSVLKSFEALAKEGCAASYVDVDKDGFVQLDKLKMAVRQETALVSIMYANNEVGTIQPIAKIGKWLKKENQKREAKNLPRILFHTDACQAAGFLDLNVQKLGVDLMSVNGGKIYGPKQSGFLYAKSDISIKPLIWGGGQEADLRSGTENVPGIVGLAKALELAQKNLESENQRLLKLRDYFILKVLEIPKTILNGPAVKNGGLNRLPNNINVSFLGAEGETLMLYLDSYGVAVSTGSACATGLLDPSHALLALGLPEKQAQSSIRFTLGKSTNKKQLDFVVGVLKKIILLLRKVKNPKM